MVSVGLTGMATMDSRFTVLFLLMTASRHPVLTALWRGDRNALKNSLLWINFAS